MRAGVPWGSAAAPQERAPAGREKPASTAQRRRWLGHAWERRHGHGRTEALGKSRLCRHGEQGAGMQGLRGP